MASQQMPFKCSHRENIQFFFFCENQFLFFRPLTFVIDIIYVGLVFQCIESVLVEGQIYAIVFFYVFIYAWCMLMYIQYYSLFLKQQEGCFDLFIIRVLLIIDLAMSRLDLNNFDSFFRCSRCYKDMLKLINMHVSTVTSTINLVILSLSLIKIIEIEIVNFISVFLYCFGKFLSTAKFQILYIFSPICRRSQSHIAPFLLIFLLYIFSSCMVDLIEDI